MLCLDSLRKEEILGVSKLILDDVGEVIVKATSNVGFLFTLQIKIHKTFDFRTLKIHGRSARGSGFVHYSLYAIIADWKSTIFFCTIESSPSSYAARCHHVACCGLYNRLVSSRRAGTSPPAVSVELLSTQAFRFLFPLIFDISKSAFSILRRFSALVFCRSVFLVICLIHTV